MRPRIVDMLRFMLLTVLRYLGSFQPISLDTLLFGNDRFNSNDNITIQIALQKYTIDTKRFTQYPFQL